MEAAHLLDRVDLEEPCRGNPQLRKLAEEERLKLKTEVNQEGFKDPPPRFEMNWANRVILAGLPVIGPSKLEALKKVLIKVLTKAEIAQKVTQIDIPIVGETSSGVGFLTMDSEDAAKDAIKVCNGLSLDVKHTFRTFSFEEFDRILTVPDEYVEPAIFSKAELMSWLTDQTGRDQLVLRHDANTAVYWNDIASRQPELIPTEKLWSDRYVFWSASGTYLASMHQNGVILWAGSEFIEYKRFSHSQVSQLEFSPCERYLLTFSAAQATFTYVIWNIRTGQDLRTFRSSNEPWGAYKWSHSGDYIAKISENLISVYRSTNMQLLEDSKGNKTSIKADGIKSFMWSTGTDLLSYFVVSGDTSRIKLLAIPSREELHSRTLANAQECSLAWQGEGAYLAALTTQVTKKGKPKDSTLEVFFFEKKGIPVVTVALSCLASQLSWEAQGSRFSLIAVEDRIPKMRVYQLNLERTDVELLLSTEIEGKEVFWAPQGGHFVVCNRAKLSTSPGLLEFYVIRGKSLHCLNKQNHPYLTHVEWDQSGLHLISSTRQNLAALASGNSSTYTIWTCQGQVIYSAAIKNLYQILWRPRPKYVLPKDKQQEAEDRMHQQAQNYIEYDKRKAEETRLRAKLDKERKRKLFFDNFGPLTERWVKTNNERAAILGYTEEQERRRWREEIAEVETFIKTKTGGLVRK